MDAAEPVETVGPAERVVSFRSWRLATCSIWESRSVCGGLVVSMMGP